MVAKEVRAQQLGIIHCFIGIKDKQAALSALQNQLGVNTAQNAFVGDDLNDRAVRPVVGLLFSPTDACKPISQSADAVLRCRGGHGPSGNWLNAFFNAGTLGTTASRWLERPE